MQIQIQPSYFTVIEIRFWCQQQKLQILFRIQLFHAHICWQSFSDTFWHPWCLLPWILDAPAGTGEALARWCLRQKQTLSCWGSAWGDIGQSPVSEQSNRKAKVSAVCQIKGKVTLLGINSKFEGGEVWLWFLNSVQDSERECQKKIALGELFSHGISSQKQVVTRSLLRHIEWGTEKKRKKGLWDLRQDVDDLRHPLPKLSSRKTPANSHTALQVPASTGLQWGADAGLPNPTPSYTAWASLGTGRNPWLQTVKPPRDQEIWNRRVLSTGICVLNKATSPQAVSLLWQHKSHLPHQGFSHIL